MLPQTGTTALDPLDPSCLASTLAAASTCVEARNVRAVPGLPRPTRAVVCQAAGGRCGGLPVQPHRLDPRFYPGSWVSGRSDHRAVGYWPRAAADSTAGNGGLPRAGGCGARATHELA